MYSFKPINTKGFDWFQNKDIYFKGYFFDSNNKLYKGNNAINFFEKNSKKQDFLKALNSINGIYSVVIFKQNYCFVSCDTSRIFPIFYTKYKNNLILSDNAVFLKNKTNSSFNNFAQEQFRGFSHTLGKYTMLKNIFQVQSSEYLIFENGIIESKGFHFSYAVKKYYTLNYNNLFTKVSNTFNKSFKRLINTLNNKTVVIPLSGGFDSRLIATMFKKYDYKNVICYTYGKNNITDVQISKKVAQKLGFKWYFIEYTDELINGFIDETFTNYCNSIFNCSSMLFLQEYFAVKHLNENNLIPKDSVFIPGHSGDLLGGSQIIKNVPLNLKSNNISSELMKQKFDYSKASSKQRKAHVISIENLLSDFNNNYKDFIPQSVFEDFDIKEKIAKVIFNSAKVYEYFDYQFRIPFWDLELLKIFKKIPLELKVQKKFYDDILINEYFSKFNINFEKELNPSLFTVKLQKIKESLKPFFPTKLIHKKLLKNDWLNAKTMTDEMEKSMKINNLPYNSKIKVFNEINIQWYIYFCKGLIKK